MKQLDAAAISSLCMELQLLVRAGIPVSEGIYILSRDETDVFLKAYLERLHDHTDGGSTLHAALRLEGGFPDYAVNMIEAGETTGKLEATLRELSVYYESREELSQTVRSAVVYPAILLVMVLFVIVILVAKVLPIFNDVFTQLGSTMSGFAAFAMRIGAWINANALLFLLVILVIAGAALAFALVPGLRRKVSFSRRTGKLADKMACERFAAAMSMAISSGLDNDSALEMAEKLADHPAMSRKIAVCKQEMADGISFAKAIADAAIFSPLCCRMIEVGVKTGSTDTVMAEIARRYSEEVENGIAAAVRRVEPTIVIVMSGIVGVILLSVMLPLMSIMSSLI